MRQIHAARFAVVLLALILFVLPGPGVLLAQGQQPPGPSAPGRKTVTIERGGRMIQTTVLEQERAPDGRPMRAGSLIVKFRPGAAQPARESAHRGVGALAADPLGLPDAGRVQIQPGTTARAIAAYRAHPDVEFVEPDYVVRATHMPNDPGFVVQWGLTKIGMPAAWDHQQSGSGTRIAILDCGIFSSSSTWLTSDDQPGHPDIRDKVILERDFTASPHGADDLCNHGTHVAGIAAASTNNGLGVAGVGYNASILNGKVLGDDGLGSTSMAASGIVWAADNGARVINMSLGGPGACSQTMANAINYAWQHGAVIVASAGNGGSDGVGDPAAGTPANCPNVIAVAATDQGDRRASFSNYASGVDVAAPGVEITSTNNTGNYEPLDGTSMAAPHVAGLAALVWSTSYGTSNRAVVDRITSTADRVAGTGTLWTHGRINAAAAVAASVAPPVPPIVVTPPCPSPRPAVKVTVSRTGVDTLNVSVTAGHGPLSSLRFGNATNAQIDVSGGQSNMTGNFVASIPAGTTSATFTVRRAQAGAMTVPLTVVDGCGDWPTFVGRGSS